MHTGQAPLAGADRIDLVLFMPGPPVDRRAAATVLRSALLLARLTQPLLERVSENRSRAAFITFTRLDGSLGLAGSAELGIAELGGLSGLVKTLAVEAPTLFTRAIDVDPVVSADDAVRLLLAELHDADTGITEVGHAGDGTRRTVALTDQRASDDGLPSGADTATLGAGDLLVVTGGARGITAECVRALARAHRPGFLLLGRTELRPEPAWAADVLQDNLRQTVAAQLTAANGIKPMPREVERVAREMVANREISGTLADLRAAGTEAEYFAVDITHPGAVRDVLAPYRERITGIVHGAGVLADDLIVAKRADDVDRVLGTKLDGLSAVLGAVDHRRLAHVVLFSSVAGFFGNRGQADYAMANEALNRIVCSLRRARPELHAISLNWGAWAGGMVTPALARVFGERGIPLIPPELGAQLFVEQFSPGRGDDVVAVLGPELALSARELRALPACGLRISRDLASVATEKIVTDHIIGGVRVLPATAMVGALLNLAAAVQPGARPCGVRDFTVFKGVSFTDGETSRLTYQLSPADGGVAVLVQDEQGRPRYRAEVRTGQLPATPPRLEPRLCGGGEPVDVYRDGTLFHGSALQGIERLIADTADGLVLGCRLADYDVAHGQYAIAEYSPVIADVVLQACAVWVRRHHDLSSLPSFIGELTVHGAVPGENFIVAVRNMRQKHSAFRFTVTAHDPATGAVFLALTDVEVVASVALNEKFAASAR